MINRYTIANSNDLLLSATRYQPKRLKKYLIAASLLFTAGICWLGIKNSAVPLPTPQHQTNTNKTSTSVAQVSITSELLANINTTTLAKASTFQPAVVKDLPALQTITLKKGDTLGKVFQQLGLSAKELQTVMKVKEAAVALHHLQPGKEIKLLINPDKKLQQLVFALNTLDTLEISRINNHLKAAIKHQKPEIQVTYTGATVTRTLAQATQKAGIQSKLTNQLVSIFKDKIDLTKVRAGDHLKLLFEENYLKGKKVGTGNIVAAEVNVQNKVYRAVRYVDAKGNVEYFTPEGLSLKKGFVRYPLKYAYIGSGFTHSRFDPVLHRMAKHEAIDFVAPSGTPIKATSDGKVIYAAYNHGGYGNMVKIKHDQKYTTLYAHMVRFAKDVHAGTNVKAGQVIGYVGSTGMATGAHLHYEFYANGMRYNPLTVALPSAPPLNKKARAKFIPLARQLVARLDSSSAIRLVENNHNTTNG